MRNKPINFSANDGSHCQIRRSDDDCPCPAALTGAGTYPADGGGVENDDDGNDERLNLQSYVVGDRVNEWFRFAKTGRDCPDQAASGPPNCGVGELIFHAR